MNHVCVGIHLYILISCHDTIIITVPWEEYGRVIHAFLTGFGTGVDVDFSTRRLVGIGHSMGAVGLYVHLSFL
jgi:hypothetical protein